MFTSETWSIRIAKEYLKFSAAHFLIFEDGTAERLHGHNYRVSLELQGGPDEHGVVIDFKLAKDLLRGVLGSLDERVLIPGQHAELTCTVGPDDRYEIRYRDKHYSIPREDVVVLDIANSSSESLARWIARRTLDELSEARPDVRVTSLEVAVEETPGQAGCVTLRPAQEAPRIHALDSDESAIAS